MLIEWSDKDQVYIVTLPEWQQAGLIGHTHGKTYEEAVKNGQELIELLVESWQERHLPLPDPRVFVEA